MANDGGVYFCDDGGRQESSWNMAAGLETLDPVNIAGLAGNGSEPALYLGCGDNNDFFTRDGGQHWEDPGSGCGDCDSWFSDTAQAGRGGPVPAQVIARSLRHHPERRLRIPQCG